MLYYKKKNDKNKYFVLMCFLITDLFPIIYLIYNNKVILQFKSFILSIIILLIYLIYMKSFGNDINKLYSHFLLDKNFFN